MTRICHLTHYDLDAGVSSLLAEKLYNFDVSKCQGYAKVNASIEYLKRMGNEHLIVTDLCLEEEQMKDVLQHFDKVTYYDHHQGSENYQELNVPGFEKHISMDMSASALVMLDIMKKNKQLLTKPLLDLAMYTDVYDMWKTDNEHWDIGYNLNELFWKYHYFDFVKRFRDGFDGFTDEETKYLKDKLDAKLKRIEEIPKEELEGNSAMYILETVDDKGLINEFSLRKPGYNVYFMVSFEKDGFYRASARIRNDGPENANLDAIINELRDSTESPPWMNDIIQTCGGHERAAGIEFSEGVGLETIADFLEEVSKKVSS